MDLKVKEQFLLNVVEVNVVITIAVVLPTTINKIGSKSLNELVDFYKSAQNNETAQICQAAIACGVKAYKLQHKVREIVHIGEKKKLHHVSLSLDFNNINDMTRFMNAYTMLVT